MIEKIDLISGQRVWGCAYRTNNTEKTMRLKKEPVLGIIDGCYFYEINKKGEKIKSSKVHINSRQFASTKEESIRFYNNSIQKQINFLESLIKDCRDDFIGGSNND